MLQRDADPQPRRLPATFWISLVLYGIAFLLPAGTALFVCGGFGVWMWLMGLPKLMVGGLSAEIGPWLAFGAALVPWLANVAFWIALVYGICRRWRRAMCWAGIAVALASVFFVTKEPQVPLSAAYFAWLGSMASLAGVACRQFLRAAADTDRSSLFDTDWETWRSAPFPQHQGSEAIQKAKWR